MKKIFITLPYEVLDIKNVNYAVVAEIELMTRSSFQPLTFFNAELLSCYLPDIEQDNIATTLLSLYKAGHIKKDGEMYWQDKEAYDLPAGKQFLNIYADDFLAIDSSDLFNFFIILMRSIDTRCGCGYMTTKYLADKAGIVKSTVSKYIAKLEELQLIYVRRVTENGRSRNYYGRYEDRKLIDSFKTNGSKQNGNFHRSVSQRYNRFIKNGAEGIDVYQLYKDVLRYNAEVEREKDVSVFAPYLTKLKGCAII